MFIEESYVTDRGRRRRRSVRIDLDAVRRDLGIASAEELRDWQRIRDQLRRRVGDCTFEIWLDPIELIAIDSDQRFVLAPPAATTAWTAKRFGRVLTAIASEAGREVRFASEPERHACSPSTALISYPKEAAG